MTGRLNQEHLQENVLLKLMTDDKLITYLPSSAITQRRVINLQNEIPDIKVCGKVKYRADVFERVKRNV